MLRGSFIVTDVSGKRVSPTVKVQEEIFVDCLTLGDGTRSVPNRR
jgi:hypothetical protein